MAIYELVKEGVIEFPNTIFTPYFIYQFPGYFISSFVAIEFFSDFKRENITISENMLKPTINEAKEEGGFYQYYDKKKKVFTDTYYSPDKNGSRKSQFICYNKLAKSIKDNNHASVEILKQYQNPIRCEFKVFINNSIWLNWNNLKGTYQQVFNRYRDYLAVIYNNQVQGCIKVKSDENPNFISIVRTANKNNMVRFRNPRGFSNRKKRGMGNYPAVMNY